MLTQDQRSLLRNLASIINHLLVQDNEQRALLRAEFQKQHPEYFDKRSGKLKKAYRNIELPYDI